MHTKAVLLLAVLAIDATDAHAGACALRVPTAGPLVAPPTLTPGGAVIAGWSPTGRAAAGDLSRWKLRLRGKRVKTTVVTLAPGLVALTPAKRGRGLSLFDEQGQAVATVALAADGAAPLAAPTITAAFVRSYATRDGTRRELLADLSVPDDALVALVYEADAAANAAAVSWARVAPGVRTTLYADPGRCELKPPGMHGVDIGAKVQVAWLDRQGRVSPRSAPFVVTIDPEAPTTPSIAAPPP